jgi:hypothetical protein
MRARIQAFMLYLPMCISARRPDVYWHMAVMLGLAPQLPMRPVVFNDLNTQALMSAGAFRCTSCQTAPVDCDLLRYTLKQIPQNCLRFDGS